MKRRGALIGARAHDRPRTSQTLDQLRHTASPLGRLFHYVWPIYY